MYVYICRTASPSTSSASGRSVFFTDTGIILSFCSIFNISMRQFMIYKYKVHLGNPEIYIEILKSCVEAVSIQ